MLSASLASHTNIKHITTEGLRSRIYTPGHPLTGSICEMPFLESLSITGLFLGARTVARLGAMIAKDLIKGVCQNSNLEAVRLSYAAIGTGGGSALGEYLATSSKWRYLSLLYFSCHLAEAEANSFGVLLESNTTLLGLDLSSNEINDIGAIRIARSLKFNEHLQKLDLSKNCITYQGAAPLAEALASNRVLKELALWDVSDAKKERPLASALSRNAVPGRVLHRHESIASVLQLATGVPQNADLVTVLHLDACVHVNAYCLKTLFVSLAAIPCLKSLLLECKTSFNRSAAEKFAELLLKTRALERVQISHWDMDPVALQTVMNGLAENRAADPDFNSLLASCGRNPVLRTLKVSPIFSVFEKPSVEGLVFEISEVLRRNESYCNRAVEFAIDPKKFGTQREPAAVFDELCHKESFKELLSKVAGPDHAIHAVRKARRHITENLLAMTGVSRQFPVTCWPHPEGSRQIDILNTYCWRSILSCVKVTDIVV
ncbi:hypothetical protein MTO96_037386 [Rhipicephalus appendiculatus]